MVEAQSETQDLIKRIALHVWAKPRVKLESKNGRSENQLRLLKLNYSNTFRVY